MTTKVMVYASPPPKNGGPYCGEYLFAEIPKPGTSITIVVGGRPPAIRDEVTKLEYYGIAVGASGTGEARAMITFKPVSSESAA